jgi:MFS family permease
MTRTLTSAQFVNSLGDGAFYACSALYFTRVVHLSAAEVGLALTIGWATGMLAGVPLGTLADRWGPRRTAVTLAVATATALGGFLLIRSFPLFIVVVCGYAVAQSGLAAARQALLAALVPPAERVAVRARLQATLNAGLAVGAAIGGLALSVDTRPAYLAVFAADAVAFLASALLLLRLPQPTRRPQPPAGPRLTVLRDRPYAVLTLLTAIGYLNMPVLSLGLPLWIAQRTDAPKPLAAALLIVNMLAVTALQVRVARWVTNLRTATRTAARAGIVLAAACVVYGLSGGSLGAWVAVAVLLGGAAVQVLGEMMHGAAAWEAGFGLAPADRQGQYQGLFGTAPQIARMCGPVVVTTLLVGWGTPGWLVLGGLFLVAGLLFGPVVRWAQRQQERGHRNSTRTLGTLPPVAATAAAGREFPCEPSSAA